MGINSKLLEVQKKCMQVGKGGNNPHFKSTYATYEDMQNTVFPHLHNAGLLISQPTVIVDGKNYIKSIITDIESGETVEGLTEIIFVSGNAQSQGSGITYARRYGLMSLLALCSVDDDGNDATFANKQYSPISQERYEKAVAAEAAGYKDRSGRSAMSLWQIETNAGDKEINKFLNDVEVYKAKR